MPRVFILAVCLSAVLGGCAGTGFSVKEDNSPVADFKLTTPAKSSEIAYLGVDKNSLSFQLSQIKARAVLIEVFSMYCPYCQQGAPKVNELYRLIQANGLAGKIKMIGIGYTNSQQETEIFKEKFAVPFPVFADFHAEISTALKVSSTPAFVFVINGAGPIAIRRREGELLDPAKFLDTLKKALEEAP